MHINSVRIFSKHRTLSSPQENKYGCLSEIARPHMFEIQPVRESSVGSLDARSHNLTTWSTAPVTTATDCNQPRCPETTCKGFHYGWYVGLPNASCVVHATGCSETQAMEVFVEVLIYSHPKNKARNTSMLDLNQLPTQLLNSPNPR